jgi:hypothetical protein
VGQLVQQNPGQLVGRKLQSQIGRQQEPRPEEAPDRGCGQARGWPPGASAADPARR